MSKDANKTPAMQADIQRVIQLINQLYTDSERRRDEIFAKSERWKNESIEEMKRHFDVTLENIHHDLARANRDRVISLKNSKIDHEQRLMRLERSVGFCA
jgi:hypothetical protein